MSWGRQGVLMGLTAIVDLLRTLTAIVDWESRVALTPVPLGARLADLDSHESQASLLSHSLLGDQIQKVNCATECEDLLVKELRPYNYQLDQLIQAVQSRPA